MSRKTIARFINGLGIFFLAGSVISGVSAFSFLFPGSFLEPMWRLNPRAHDAFKRIGALSVLLLLFVSILCLLAGIGFLKRKRWGHRVGVALLAVNLIGDIVNAALGIERRAIIGIPIAGLLVFLLLRPKVQAFFQQTP